jgi:chemotaxis protein methyltransferase CheR
MTTLLGVQNKPKLAKEAFDQLRTLIYSKCGISFSDAKKYLLESRLAKRIEERGLKTFEDYIYFLNYDAQKESEIISLINTIVTNETSFFRDPVQLKGFDQGVVPRMIEEKKKINNKRFKVWSAASSTGEEPYTLAIMLLELGLGNTGWSLEITGSDISDNVLRSAKAATYEQYAIRNATPKQLKSYFNQNDKMYTVKPEVQRLVRFKKINLMNSFETRLVKDNDVIFCRNVLIYFDDISKKKAVTNLYDSLVKGGYLFIGFSESLHDITRLFKPVRFCGTMVYQKI